MFEMLKLQAPETFQNEPPGFQESVKIQMATLFMKYQQEKAARQQAPPVAAPPPPPPSILDDGLGMAARTRRPARLTASAPDPSYDSFDMRTLYGTLEAAAAPSAAPPRQVQPLLPQALPVSVTTAPLAQQAPVGLNPALVKQIAVQTLHQCTTALETFKDVERYMDDYNAMMDPELKSLAQLIKDHQYLGSQLKSKILRDIVVILEYGGVNAQNIRTDHDKRLQEDETYRQNVQAALAAAPDVLNHLLAKARSEEGAPTEQALLADSAKASLRFIQTHQPRPVQAVLPERVSIFGATARTNEWLRTMGIEQSPEQANHMIEAFNLSLGSETESEINGYTAPQLLFTLDQMGQQTRDESDRRVKDLIAKYHNLTSTMLRNNKLALQNEYAQLRLSNLESVKSIIKLTVYGMVAGRTVPMPLPTPIVELLFDKYPAFAQFIIKLSVRCTDEVSTTRKTRKRLSTIVHLIYLICKLYGLKDNFILTKHHPCLEPLVHEFMALVQKNFDNPTIDVSQLLGFFDGNAFDCPIHMCIAASPVVVLNKVDGAYVVNGLEVPHVTLMDAESTISWLTNNHARGALHMQAAFHPISRQRFTKDDVYRPSPALSALVVTSKVIRKIKPLTTALPPQLRDIETYGYRTYRRIAEARAHAGLPPLPVIQAASM